MPEVFFIRSAEDVENDADNQASGVSYDRRRSFRAMTADRKGGKGELMDRPGLEK